MSKGTCPKCNEGVLIEQTIDPDIDVSSNDFAINRFPLTPYCCNKCGYTEFYASGFE